MKTTIERKRRMRKRPIVDYIKGLYETLSKATGLSPRLVKGVHEMHTERCWCGHWVDALFGHFVFVGEDERRENINSLLDYLERKRNTSDVDFFNEIRINVEKRLGRPRRPLVTRTRG